MGNVSCYTVLNVNKMCETISDTVIKCELLNIDYINSSDQTIEEFGYTLDIDPPVKCELIDVRSECEPKSSDKKPVHQKFPFSVKAILATEHIEEDVDGNDMIKALRAQNSHRNRIMGYRCKWNECDYVNRAKKEVEMHAKEHKADELSNTEIIDSFICDYPECSFASNRKQNLNNHKKIHSKTFLCDWPECGQRFARNYLLNNHVKRLHEIHYRFGSDLTGCDKVVSSDALKQHKADKHSNIIYSFACDYPECSFTTNCKQNLNNHMNCHSRPFVCDWPECGQRFARNYVLTNHKKALHERQYRFRCDWTGCDKVYTSRRTLNDHKAIHTGKKYVCIWPGCEYSANRRSSLRVHKKIHLGIKKKRCTPTEKRFVCNWPECGKKFVDNFNLIKHMRVHSGERPFKCEWTDCQRSFAEQGNLIKHMRTHTSKQR